MEYERGADESVTEALHGATSRCSLCAECTFDPINDVVDPEALARVVAARDGSDAIQDCWATLAMEDCFVTVTDDVVRIEATDH